MSLKAAPTLAKQHTLALVLSFVTLQLVVMALLVGGVVWPMAKRSADDWAGLVVLAAQTWAELPPNTRPAFEAELARSHQLAVRPLTAHSGPNGMNLADKLAEGAAEEMHPPFVSAFEAAMSQRMGRSIHVTRFQGPMANTDWYWVAMSGLAPDDKQGRGLAVGWSHDRIDSQPMAVAVFGYWVSLGLGRGALVGPPLDHAVGTLGRRHASRGSR